MAAKTLKIALIQLAVSGNKHENIQRAVQFVKIAADNGCRLIVLPECFNSPYDTKLFSDYAEEVPTGPTSAALAAAAKENEVFLVGGSIPELDRKFIYNTCTVWSPQGDLIAKHRKMHLFDIDVPGGIRFKESEILRAGNQLTMFDVSVFRIGIGICYDLRFGEMATAYRKKGCQVLLYPGAFNMTTGPPHWELLLRSRALDNQAYVAGIAPARDKEASYTSFANTMMVDPWGTVIRRTETDETIVYGEIDSELIHNIRQQIPIFNQRRHDIYDTVLKSQFGY